MPAKPGVVSFTEKLTKYAGGCFIVVPDGGRPGKDICILVKLQDTRSLATQNITGFSKGIHTPRIYDLEKDGNVGERPAVILSSVMVEKGNNRTYMYLLMKSFSINVLQFYVVVAGDVLCTHLYAHVCVHAYL